MILSQTSSVFLPASSPQRDKLSFALISTAPGFLVGFMEELGWTGFATPGLRLQHGISQDRHRHRRRVGRLACSDKCPVARDCARARSTTRNLYPAEQYLDLDRDR